MKKKVILIIVIIGILIPAVLWASALIKCEILTQKYYDDFKQAYTQNTMLRIDDMQRQAVDLSPKI